MSGILLGTGLVLSCIAGVLGESTCTLVSESYGHSITTTFQCPKCCCDEPSNSRCCQCWWEYVIGPVCSLIGLCVVGICFYRAYRIRQRNRMRQSPPGQILYLPPNNTALQSTSQLPPGTTYSQPVPSGVEKRPLDGTTEQPATGFTYSQWSAPGTTTHQAAAQPVT